jgi:hypothetical protein
MKVTSGGSAEDCAETWRTATQSCPRRQDWRKHGTRKGSSKSDSLTFHNGGGACPEDIDDAKAALNACAQQLDAERQHGDRMLKLLRAVDEAWGGHGEDNREIYVVGPGAEPFLKALSEVEEYLSEP